jgi:uncharacterized membrane protein
MRLIIVILGTIFLDLLSKHFGIEIGTKPDVEFVTKVLCLYAIIFDITKK